MTLKKNAANLRRPSLNEDIPKHRVSARSDIREGTFLKEVRVDYGPSELLSRFFIAAENALSEHGITLSLASFDELLAANEANRDCWLPLNPTFHPKNGNVSPENAFCLLGRNRSGKIVTAQAMRIFEWQQTDFKMEAESLRLLYATPNPDCASTQSCSITAPSARLIHGRVGYGGAIWIHPSIRGRDIAPWTSRVSRAYAHTRWQIDLAFGITSAALLAKGFIEALGWAHSEPGVAFVGFAECPRDGAMFWSNADEMIQDFATHLDSEAQVSSDAHRIRNAQ